MVAVALRDAGDDASHVTEHGFLSATDEVIFEWADRNAAVVVTSDRSKPEPLFHRVQPTCGSGIFRFERRNGARQGFALWVIR